MNRHLYKNNTHTHVWYGSSNNNNNNNNNLYFRLFLVFSNVLFFTVFSFSFVWHWNNAKAKIVWQTDGKHKREYKKHAQIAMFLFVLLSYYIYAFSLEQSCILGKTLMTGCLRIIYFFYYYKENIFIKIFCFDNNFFIFIINQNIYLKKTRYL